jgi:hypothetical protein
MTSVPEQDWKRRRSPEGAWEEVARQLRENPPGTEIPLWWYGPRTAPNGAWMRDKCRRLGIESVVISHRREAGTTTTVLSISPEATK